MEHTIFNHGNQSAVIVMTSPTQYTVTAYVGETPTVAWDTDSAAEAERWAKAVIEYPE